MSRLYDAELLLDEKLDSLSEMFSATLAIARVKGQKNLDWTDCYDSRCTRLSGKYEMDLCKENCHLDAIDKALTRAVTLRSQCNETNNPKICIKSVNAALDTFRKKRIKIRAKMADITRKLAAQRRRTGGR